MEYAATVSGNDRPHPAPIPRHRALSAASRYSVALLLVFSALCLTLALQKFEAGRPTLFLFFAAIVASAWFGGAGPGFAAVTLSIPAGLYFYATALHSFAISLDNIVLFVFFLVCAMAGGMLSSWRRNAEEGLQKTHSQLETKARELQETNNALLAEIAERKRAEGALQDTQTELARVARLTTMGEMAASIAHEINQPLAAAAISAGSCVRWLDAPMPNLREARDAATHIIRDVNRASEVVGRVRAMVRKALPERTCLDINSTIEDVITLVDNELLKHHIELHMDVDRGLPAVLGDRIQLQQVFLNLFMNAMEAMSSIADRPRQLMVRSRCREDGIVITVQDSGEGFQASSLDALFEAFVTTKPNGMGLGLSICRSIIEAHGGTLSASPVTPHGAAFNILLPQNEG